MPNDKETHIAELLAAPVLGRFATVDTDTHQPHLVPLWFLWDGESAWISSFKGTRKVKELRSNLRAALLVEPDGQHPSPLQAVLLEGAVELVESPQDFISEQALRIYTKYLGDQGALASEPQSWAHDPQGLIICLRPEKIIAW
ncbi:MAG: hypothetical protein H6Q38_2642 [Chloroflexi bacterium]|nr:hypothetical protein [Chloroflexota bacterium]